MATRQPMSKTSPAAHFDDFYNPHPLDSVHRLPLPHPGHPRPCRAYIWDPLSAGDCHQQRAVLRLLPDGNGTWDAYVRTDHSIFGDIWHCPFDVRSDADPATFVLSKIGRFDSAKMYPNSGWVHFYREFTFPVDKYVLLPRTASRVTQSYDC